MMKKLHLLKLVILFLMLSNKNSYSQGGMLTSFENLIGESSNYYVGLHSGLFDSNQKGGYAYNIGTLLQYHYTPDNRIGWFINSEFGAFYVQSKLDDQNRQTKLAIFDFSIVPSFSIPFASGISGTDGKTLRRKKISKSRKIKIGLGVTAAIPVYTASTGSKGINLDAIKTGFGFTLKSSLDILYNLGLLMSVTRIGTDLDGFGYESSTSTIQTAGNKHDVSYYYKFGGFYRF